MSILKMRKGFGKLRKKCLINFVSQDSGGLSLQKKKKKIVWHKGYGGILGSYSIKTSNGKKNILTQHCKYRWIFFKKNPPESLPLKFIEHFLHSFPKFLRIFEIEVEKYAYWHILSFL